MCAKECLDIVSFSTPFHPMKIYDNDILTFSYSRMPHLFTKDIALVQQLFEALCKVGKHIVKFRLLHGYFPGSLLGGKHHFSVFTGRTRDSTCHSGSLIYDGWSI